jgi:cytochrome c553
MTRRLWRLLGVIGGAAVILSAGFVLGLPFASRAQQPTQRAATAAVPPGDNYVGAETCKGCHEEAFNKFSHTRMGRLFLKQPRSAKEANGCENCHGPGKDHVDAGGGKGKGGMITFAKNDPTPVEKRNAVCLSCHTKGARLFWQGSAHE